MADKPKLSIPQRVAALEADVRNCPQASELEELVDDLITQKMPDIIRRVRDAEEP